jgi:hypothetical protein
MSHARFQKQQREKARREKAAAKQERKAVRADASASDDEAAAPSAPEPTVLADLARLHEQFAADEIDFDAFEERKQELLAQLEV